MLSYRLIKRFTSRLYAVNARRQKRTQKRIPVIAKRAAGFQIGRSLKHAMAVSRLRIAW